MARLLIVLLLFVIAVNAHTFNEEQMTESIKNLENQILTMTTRINNQQEEMANLKTAIAQQNVKFAELNTNIAHQDTKMAKQDTAFATINTRFAELDCIIDKNRLKAEGKQNQREPCDCKAGKPINIALKKPATQSSTYDDATADRAVDGNTTTSGSCAHTGSEKDSWWCVDLQREYNISHIEIINRNRHQSRLAGFNVRFSTKDSCDGNGFNSATVCYTEPGVKKDWYVVKGCDDGRQMSGRYVFIGGPGQYLTICEVEIYSK